MVLLHFDLQVVALQRMSLTSVRSSESRLGQIPRSAPGSGDSEALPSFVLRGHQAPVNVVRFQSRAPILWSADANGLVISWSMETRRPIGDIHPPNDSSSSGIGSIATNQSSILNLEVLSDSEGLILQRKSGVISLWDIEASRTISSFQSGCFTFTKCSVWNSAFSQSTLLAAPSENASEVKVWDVRAKSIAFKLLLDGPAKKRGSCTAIQHVRGKSSDVILCGAEDGSISTWDLRILDTALCSLDQQHKHPCLTMAIRPRLMEDPKIFGLSGSAGRSIIPFAFDLDQCSIFRGSRIPLQYAGVGEIRSSSDGEFLAVGLWDHSALVLDWKTLEVRCKTVYHEDSVFSVDIQRFDDTLLMATASKDQRIAIFAFRGNQT